MTLSSLDLLLAACAAVGGLLFLFYQVKFILAGDYASAYAFRRGRMPNSVPMAVRVILRFSTVCLVIVLLKITVAEIASGRLTFRSLISESR